MSVSYSRILVTLYFLSGLTGIAYEVLWVRMLSLQFGVSIFGVVITVAAFMAGLGFGSLSGAWFSRHTARPLMLFALLEGGVALFALGLPHIFQTLDIWLGTIAVNASLVQWYGIQGTLSFLLLLLPALALGAGFPLILKGLSNSPVTLARIYGLNTLGGAFGALLPLALLPALGWSQSVWVVAILGLCIALAVFILTIIIKQNHFAAAATTNGITIAHRPSLKALIAYAGIGAGALILEIAWTRIYGMILLRTEYVLAIILAVFLAGIGLGSILVRHGSSTRWLTWFPALAGGLVLFSLWGLPVLAGWVDNTHYESLSNALLMQGLALAVLTFPVTLILGAWLPLLSKRVAGSDRIAGAWLYGSNATGAALGSIIGGFVLIPWLGTSMTICVAAAALFIFGMVWSGSRKLWLAGLALVVVALPVSTMPDVNILLPVTQQGSRNLQVYEDALNITHVVEQPDGQRLLLSDLRRMDASTDPTAIAVQMNQARLPLLLHPRPHSVLFLGVGTGISAAGSLIFPDVSVTGVELSRGAISAAKKWFAPVNRDVIKRIKVVHDDARRFLRADNLFYDVIIGDLFHPDLVGRSNLLSIQQFRRAREHLAPHGLFVQWLALNQFDTTSLDIVLRTFRQVFPNAVLFMDGFRLALVGPRDDLQGYPAMMKNVRRLDKQQLDMATGGEGIWTWLGRFWGTLPSTKGPVQDEWAPQIEFRLPQSRYKSESDLAVMLEYLLGLRTDLAQGVMRLHVPDEHQPDFERAFIATELAVRSWLATLDGRINESQRLTRLSYEANNRDRWIGFDLADKMYATLDQAVHAGRDKREALETILAIRPDHIATLKALWRLELGEGNQSRADEILERLQLLSPLDRDIATAIAHSSGQATNKDK
jgi:spermidine synthase